MTKILVKSELVVTAGHVQPIGLVILAVFLGMGAGSAKNYQTMGLLMGP